MDLRKKIRYIADRMTSHIVMVFKILLLKIKLHMNNLYIKIMGLFVI